MTPGEGGAYSDIFEQHRLSLFFGVQIRINIFWVWRVFNNFQGSRVN